MPLINPSEIEALQALKSNSGLLNDQQLAQGYCGTCHEYPSPALLDKETWLKSVLPNMRRRLGLLLEGETPIRNEGIEGQVFHNVPLIDQKDWERIKDFYEREAPEELEIPKQSKAPKQGIPGFHLHTPNLDMVQPALTTSLKGDEGLGFYLGDRVNGLFYFDGLNLQLQDSFPDTKMVSEVSIDDLEQIHVLKMGYMDPADHNLGSWTKLIGQGEKVIADGLNRPVHFAFGHLLGNESPEVVISNFGNHTGDVSLFFQEHKQWKRKILIDRPGARRSVIADLNGNGLNDIIVLMTQAREGIVAMMNQGNGVFEEKTLLSFHPAFGSSYFDLLDINGNGKLDILLSNGDNADLSKILKPYHGIRIFLNQGNETFDESWFYPMYGASSILAEDFDGDGNIDIAAISFFPDWNQEPRQDFVYLKGIGGLQFDAFVLDKPLKAKWLVMEKSDIDGDGDLDIILGSFMLEQMPPRDGSPHYFEEQWLPFAVLKNQRIP
ncbi:FG-GAP repeat domain-containing protein [Pleomorphovibrio marinus]|uniref:FG-GAP repeat domain-containing protein n=1 Tax=Pleomorphovibrio marinus TaxID=2164132 RepID=UPI0013007FBC|nr:VCBS repeat-containing protein [Pleomorphovibrio marinus]